jgi:Leucine-rich repeat (LRR) protein
MAGKSLPPGPLLANLVSHSQSTTLDISRNQRLTECDQSGCDQFVQADIHQSDLMRLHPLLLDYSNLHDSMARIKAR